MSYLIQNTLIIEDAPIDHPSEKHQRHGVYRKVDILISDGIIQSIQPAGTLEKKDGVTCVDGSDKLVLSGFVNGHTHSTEMWSRGLCDALPLELWLSELVEFTPEEPNKVFLSALHVAVETLLSGGTTVLDHVSLVMGKEMETIEQCVKAYKQAGIRAIVAPLVWDIPFEKCIPPSSDPNEKYVPPVDEERTKFVVDLMKEAVEKFHDPENGIYIGVGPTGIQLASDELYKQLAALSEKHNLPRHTHLLETKCQALLSQQKFGKTAVAHLAEIGFLNQNTTCAHAIHLTDNDIEILGKQNSTIVHNPLSNLRLGSGISPLLKYKKAGVNIAFGCDGAASNDGQSYHEAMKIGSMLQSITTLEYRDWLTPFEVVKMCSEGGANGTGGRGQLGRVQEGMKADVVLYQLKNLSLVPKTDPVRMLVWGRPERVVEHVWVNGKLVVENHRMVHVDEDKLLDDIWNASEYDLNHEKSSGLRDLIEGPYRNAMKLSQQ